MERMSGLDASFLYMETPNMHMHVAFIVICQQPEGARPGPFRRVLETIEHRIANHPAFRRRLVEVPLQLHHPVWVDDPQFNLLNHIHQYTLPESGSKRDLGRHIGHLVSRQLDRTRPLWEGWVIEGLEDRNFAFVLKVHHAMVDGVSGTDLLRHLLDETADSKQQFPVSSEAAEVRPSDLELIAHAMRSRIGGTGRFFKLLYQSLGSLNSARKKAMGSSKPVASMPLTAPRTHFNNRIGPERDVDLLELSLSEIKALKNATNTTINDVILTICGGGLRSYLQSKQDLPEKSLTCLVPISVRKESTQFKTNNQVSGMWATLATDTADPMERLKRIHNDTLQAKQQHDTIGADMMQDWAEFNTPGAFNLAVRLYTSLGFVERIAPVHNTIISNVPGPRKPLYLAGSRIRAMYPLGPVMEGVGLNISLASYEDVVGLSINADSSQIQDVAEISRHIRQAFVDLKELVQQSARQTVPA